MWGVLYADNAGVISKSPEGLTNMIKVLLTVFEEAGLIAQETETETMLLCGHHPRHLNMNGPSVVVEAADQREIQTDESVYPQYLSGRRYQQKRQHHQT